MIFTRTLIAAALIALSLPAPAESRFSVGAQLGSGKLDAAFDGFTFDDSANTARVFGAWHFNDYLAAEAGFQTFGEFEQTIGTNRARVDAAGFTFGLRGRMPVTPRMSLEGRVGSLFWDGKATINAATQASPSDTNLYIGMGGFFELTPSIGLTADWTRFNLDQVDVNALSAGIEFRF